MPRGALPLSCSWPIWERGQKFDLGCILNCAVIDLIEPAETGALGVHHAGLWECDLKTENLTWSGGVYDIFGLERGVAITRDQAVRHYRADSREKLGRLRAHAIKHKRGFTLDVEIDAAAVRERRWMRVIAAPVLEGDRVVRLQGLKLII
jgi:hypothetical protein